MTGSGRGSIERRLRAIEERTATLGQRQLTLDEIRAIFDLIPPAELLRMMSETDEGRAFIEAWSEDLDDYFRTLPTETAVIDFLTHADGNPAAAATIPDLLGLLAPVAVRVPEIWELVLDRTLDHEEVGDRRRRREHYRRLKLLVDAGNAGGRASGTSPAQECSAPTIN